MNILFADDHTLVRESISEQILRIEPGSTVHQVSSIEEALTALSDSVDMIILDLQMPGMNGLEGLERMQRVAGNRPIVVLSGFSDKRTINTVLEKGVAAFIPKTVTGKALQRALQAVMDGERYIPPAALDGGDGPSILDPSERHRRVMSSDSPFRTLTEREAEILRLLIAGKSNKQIALDLDLQEITVKIHLRNAYRKIGAANRADAVRLSFEHSFANDLPG